MSAAKRGDHAAVEEVLKSGINPNTKNLDMVVNRAMCSCSHYVAVLYLQLRWTPLMWASYRGFTKTVEVLLEYEADPNIAATVRIIFMVMDSGI